MLWGRLRSKDLMPPLLPLQCALPMPSIVSRGRSGSEHALVCDIGMTKHGRRRTSSCMVPMSWWIGTSCRRRPVSRLAQWGQERNKKKYPMHNDSSSRSCMQSTESGPMSLVDCQRHSSIKRSWGSTAGGMDFLLETYLRAWSINNLEARSGWSSCAAFWVCARRPPAQTWQQTSVR